MHACSKKISLVRIFFVSFILNVLQGNRFFASFCLFFFFLSFFTLKRKTYKYDNLNSDYVRNTILNQNKTLLALLLFLDENDELDVSRTVELERISTFRGV